MNTHIETAMSSHGLEVLNNFIKKLNHEKFAYNSKAKMPSNLLDDLHFLGWQRELEEKESGKEDVKEQLIMKTL